MSALCHFSPFGDKILHDQKSCQWVKVLKKNHVSDYKLKKNRELGIKNEK
jgi:hypothetical protein